jgi:hypothetical protein
MRELFEELVQEGEKGIDKLLLERRQESVDLEFKEKTDASNGEPGRDDRRNLAKILSSFSNSMGGLVVWGVEARKNSDQIDCATNRKPILQMERFRSDVVRLISQALMPRHDGIHVEIVKTTNPMDGGYLLILVEQSERRPHRAELGVGRYYKRSGDSSIKMEHYDIEDSFKRLVVPLLDIRWETRNTGAARMGSDHQSVSVVIDISLVNASPVTARFPFLILKDLGGLAKDTLASMSGMVHQPQNQEHYFTGGADIVIHPGLPMIAVRARTPQIRAIRGRDNQWQVGQVEPIRARYTCGCYNSRHTVDEIVVPPEDFLAGVFR